MASSRRSLWGLPLAVLLQGGEAKQAPPQILADSDAMLQAQSTDEAAASRCKCAFQGSYLPRTWMTSMGVSADSPSSSSSYKSLRSYGTMCAAWDEVPGTPLYRSFCDPSILAEGAEVPAWCRIPWCFVSKKDCPSASASTALPGIDAYFSYDACGAPDCYAVSSSNCRWEPENLGKPGCECQFRGQLREDGGVYGSTCAAWDLAPSSPFYESSCSTGRLSEFCGDANHCQVPWCYVNETCNASKVPSDIHEGLFYSYNTCLGAPTCKGSQAATDGACPWDQEAANWSTRVADCDHVEECGNCFDTTVFGRSLAYFGALLFFGGCLYVFLNADGDDEDESSSSEEEDDEVDHSVEIGEQTGKGR